MKLTRAERQARMVDVFDRYSVLKAIAAARHEEWRKAEENARAARNELEVLASVEVDGE
jgi:hypothetical protein